MARIGILVSVSLLFGFAAGFFCGWKVHSFRIKRLASRKFALEKEVKLLQRQIEQ